MSNVPENILALHPAAFEIPLPQSGLSSIYVLVDPQTNKVRYVGRAQNAGSRLAAHLSFPRWERDSLKSKWLKSLTTNSLLPRMFVIEFVFIADAPEREREWIKHYRKTGEADCNGRGIISDEAYDKYRQVNIKAKEKALSRATRK